MFEKNLPVLFVRIEGDINICQDNVSIHNDEDSQSIGLTIESLKKILDKVRETYEKKT